MDTQWGIYRQDNRTGAMVRVNPTVDGKPTVFKTRKAAVDYAYDALIAGQKNTHVEYRRESGRPRRRRTVTRVPRKRIMESIETLQQVAGRHPPYTETYKYSMESIDKLRKELARRDSRKRNPRSGSPKWDRCVTDVTIKGTAASPPSVCSAALASKRARRRQRNPIRSKRSSVVRLVALYARQRGKQTLKYLGRGKFAAGGRALMFANHAQALGAARALRDVFPQALRGYTFHAK